MREQVVGVSLECPECPGSPFTALAPARHNVVLLDAYNAGCRPQHTGRVQGFLTSEGSVLTRPQALVLVRETRQLNKPLLGGPLTSGALW